MPPKDPELKARIVDAIQSAPLSALSDGSIHGVLTNQGADVSKRDVQQAAAELVSDGRLEVVARKGDDRRYGVIDRAL